MNIQFSTILKIINLHRYFSFQKRKYFLFQNGYPIVSVISVSIPCHQAFFQTYLTTSSELHFTFWEKKKVNNMPKYKKKLRVIDLYPLEVIIFVYFTWYNNGTIGCVIGSRLIDRKMANLMELVGQFRQVRR